MMVKAGNTRRGVYSKPVNQLLTLPVSHLCELVRWLLDRGGVPYRESGQVPVLHFFAFLLAGAGTKAMPVLVTNEATLGNLREAIDYIDARLPEALRLWPSNPLEREQTERLLDKLLNELAIATRNYAYAMLLPHKDVVLPLWQQRVPTWQQGLAAKIYPWLAGVMAKNLPADIEQAAINQTKIQTIFAELDGLLADGRRYLLGSQPTLVDYCLAALAAPVLLPEQFGGVEPTLEQLPAAYRAFVEELRVTPTGQLALTMYREHRPVSAPAPAFHPTSTTPQHIIPYYGSRVVALLTSASVQRAVFNWLRKHKPVVIIGKRVVVTRAVDVKDTLARDTEFTIAEINAPNMLRLNGPFFLGMDRSAQYTHEQGVMRSLIKPGDVALMQRIVRKHCDDMIQAALPIGCIDVVSQLARPVARRFIIDYLGVPGPDEVTMMRWLRALFHDLFLNLSNDRSIQITAEQAFHELGPYLLALIEQRRVLLKQGQVFDDLLSRLIQGQMQGVNDFDDDAIRRNISGLIVGALDTTSMASTLIIEQMLAKPDVMQRAKHAIEDEQKFLHLCFDLFRFNTMAAAMRRYCKQGAEIAGVKIPPETELFISTASAMFDDSAWPEPYTVRDDRPLDNYLHFGDGMHRCFGEYINRIQIPIIVAGVLRLNALKPRGSLLYDGPFPDQYVLSFEAPDELKAR